MSAYSYLNVKNIKKIMILFCYYAHTKILLYISFLSVYGVFFNRPLALRSIKYVTLYY